MINYVHIKLDSFISATLSLMEKTVVICGLKEYNRNKGIIIQEPIYASERRAYRRMRRGSYKSVG